MAKRSDRKKRSREEKPAAARHRAFLVTTEPIYRTVSYGGLIGIPTQEIIGRHPTDARAISPVNREAYRILEPNAFPEATFTLEARTIIAQCRDQLSLMCHANVLVADEVKEDPRRFLDTLRRSGDIDHVVQFGLPIFFENYSYLSALMSALVSMKAALDLFAVFTKVVMGQQTGPKDAFHRGKVDEKGKQIIGGAFVRWLKGMGKRLPQRDALVELFLQNIGDWLGSAVDYRDNLAHHGGIEGAHGSSLVLNKPVSKLRLSDVRVPTMPHGEPVVAYCEATKTKTLALIREAVVLIPGVDASMLSR
jgi:hypothetical protein